MAKRTIRMTVIRLTCEKCSYEWTPRRKDVRMCPRCKSVRWDTPKEKRL